MAPISLSRRKKLPAFCYSPTSKENFKKYCRKHPIPGGMPPLPNERDVEAYAPPPPEKKGMRPSFCTDPNEGGQYDFSKFCGLHPPWPLPPGSKGPGAGVVETRGLEGLLAKSHAQSTLQENALLFALFFGVTVAVLALASCLVAFFCVRRRRRRNGHGPERGQKRREKKQVTWEVMAGPETPERARV